MIFDAVYRTDGLPLRMQGNPLIEALPTMLEEREQIGAMANKPDLNLAESRQQTTSMRMLDVDVLDELYVPPGMSSRFATCVDQLVRRSYLPRSPLCPKATKRLYDVKSLLKDQQVHKTTLAGVIFLEGMSGMGKTRLTRIVLGRLPQVIRHSPSGCYGMNLCQVVWLSVDAPVGGSMHGLMIRMLMALDTALGIQGTAAANAAPGERVSVDTLIGKFAQVAATHKLGILHLDDFQRVTESQVGRERVLHFIMQLANVIGCPIIFSGTPATLKVLEKMENKAQGFETARRICSAGHFSLQRPIAATDAEFMNMVSILLKFQWLDDLLGKNADVFNTLYGLSCGITSVVIHLHKQAQMWALQSGRKVLALSDYQLAYDHDLKALHVPLNNLRKLGVAAEQDFERHVQELDQENGLAGILRSSKTPGATPLDPHAPGSA